MTCGFYYFFIGKRHRIDDYEITNVFNMLDVLLTNMNYTAIQT